jgi:ribosomal protein S18 acetylase RimI-like enzyme
LGGVSIATHGIVTLLALSARRTLAERMDARPAANAIIETLDPTRCSDDDWAGCYALNRTAHEEQGTYPKSLTAYRAEHLTPSGLFDQRYWVARVAGSIVAKANLTTKPHEPALANLALHVDPRHRRRGLARSLAAHALRAPGTNALQTLWVGTVHSVGPRDLRGARR